MMRKMRTEGFSTVGIMAVVLVVAFIIATGWFVWQKDKNNSTSSNQTNTTSTQPQTNTNTQQQNPIPSDPAEGGKYLVIAEWGVRVPLPESLKGDIKYGLWARASEQTEVASFEIGKLAQLPNSNCKLHAESDGSGLSGGIGVMLIRKPANLPAPAGVGDSTFTSQDGKYKYYATRLKALCASTNEQLQQDTGDALTAALVRVEQY